MPRGEGAYRPTDELQAPKAPPSAEIVDGARRSTPAMVALDWRAVNDGEVRTPASRITWPTMPAQDWALRIAVDTTPFRVVMYRYPKVGANGVPDEAAGTEQVCTGEATSCSVAANGRTAVDVRPGGATRDGYFVVQATWLVARTASNDAAAPVEPAQQGETSISWAFRITAPTVVP